MIMRKIPGSTKRKYVLHCVRRNGVGETGGRIHPSRRFMSTACHQVWPLCTYAGWCLHFEL